jgi:hypothetical protein
MLATRAEARCEKRTGPARPRVRWGCLLTSAQPLTLGDLALDFLSAQVQSLLEDVLAQTAEG